MEKKILVLDHPDGKGKKEWQKYFREEINYTVVHSIGDIKEAVIATKPTDIYIDHDICETGIVDYITVEMIAKGIDPKIKVHGVD